MGGCHIVGHKYERRKDETTVIVDTFEVTNNPKTQEQLEKIKVDFQVQSLTKGGDYIIEGEVANIVIERKEISDLFSSNHEGRLAKQMTKLKTEYPDYKKILLIEGNIGTVVNRRKRYTRGEVVDYSNKQANFAKYSAEFSGIVSSIVSTSDINIIQVSSKWQTITLLKALDEWASGRRRAERRSEVSKSEGRDTKREVEDILLTLHGVGWKKTNEILKEFVSLEEFFNDVLQNEGKKLKKVVGENLAKHILEVFTFKAGGNEAK